MANLDTLHGLLESLIRLRESGGGSTEERRKTEELINQLLERIRTML